MKLTEKQRKAWRTVLGTVFCYPEAISYQEDGSMQVDLRGFTDGEDFADALAEVHLPFKPVEFEDDVEALTARDKVFLIHESGRYIMSKYAYDCVYGGQIWDRTTSIFLWTNEETIEAMGQFAREYEARHLQDEFFIEEVFYSFQGEGLDLGMMTTFIRVLGCDMKCVGCDTFYGEATPKTIRNTPYEMWSIERLLKQVEEYKAQAVCLTGGEITLYYKKLIPLAAMLRARNNWITLQTNGKNLDWVVTGLIQSVNLDIKPPSSKQPIRLDRIPALRPGQQVKVLIGSEEDMEFALQVDEYVQTHNPELNIILQPYIFGHIHNAQGVMEGLKNLYSLMEVHAHKFKSNVRLTLQSHKLNNNR